MMKLAHAVFVYPRMELKYVKEWLDYHERMGVDHVYMTLHLNDPRDEPLTQEQIVWRKKPGVPYVMDGTELELVAQLKARIADHVSRGRVSFRTARRVMDKTGTSHRGAQVMAYRWAANQLRKLGASDWSWMAVNDIDEFFVPVDPKHNLKDVISLSQQLHPTASVLRCQCVIHPSRYDSDDLKWDTYTPVAGQRHAVAKYICDIRRSHAFNIHWAAPEKGMITWFNPPFYVHHFRGFDKYAIVQYGWPTAEHKAYVTKAADAPYQIRNTLQTPSKPKGKRHGRA